MCLSRLLRVLAVCHCFKSNGETIRIISARKVTKRESMQYWRYRHET
ncbi:hypothetical protein DMP06_04695 [Slackia equolifaciens]|uniref:BrnT family toxin n=1 Tax=Slackia equolifaciens TaxID=498718 RepID=A0A3N0B0X6_9ACTN|nr:hypothetical protein DMP06_04695 [Slackia equolifaciens]